MNWGIKAQYAIFCAIIIHAYIAATCILHKFDISPGLYLTFFLKLEPLHFLLRVCLCFQMFKGFDKAKDIQYVYTPVFSSLCGVKLDSNNKAGYLLSGIVDVVGGLYITFLVGKKQWKVQQNAGCVQ